MPYCHGRHTIRPILRSRELRMRYQTKRQKRQKNSTLPPRGNTIQNRQFRLRECYQNFTSPQAETFVFISVHGPVCGDAHKNVHSPLAGIRSGIDNSACGDAIKLLHSRERSFCNNFAEMHIKIYIPPSREYDPESTVPLAGMQ